MPARSRFASAYTVLAGLAAFGLYGPPAAYAQTPPAAQPQAFAPGAVPEPRFADPDRARKLRAAFPEIERLFTAWANRQHMPGATMGILIDGELAAVMTTGVRDVSSRAPVTPESVFRIASMTKSFTAMAIVKLRDEGKLSLDDPVARYVPELARLAYPTRDSPVLTIRHLLTHSEGFPEDNPWGDRQLAQTDETLRAWMWAGIPFSNAPGVAYEYSNYGFAILGQIVARASGHPYEAYMEANLLAPLGMRASTFEMGNVPRDRIARAYRWEANGWRAETPLAHGSFGAMGGLWTSTRDLARYVAFLMAAYPPRDEPEQGPIRRSSAREMQQAWRGQPARATRTAVDAPLALSVSAYGYGLGVSQNCLFGHVVGHGGGLPGYGSLMRWLPEYGVGLFNEAFAALERTGALQPRAAQPSPALIEARANVSRLLTGWNSELASRIAADNLFLDEPEERRAVQVRELAAKHGACKPDPAINTENALRGSWRMICERGWQNVAITLAPAQPPRVQYLNVQSVLPPDPGMTRTIEAVRQLAKSWNETTAMQLAAPGLDVQRMRQQLTTVAAQWGACRMGEVVGGDGSRNTEVTFSCDRGPLVARLAVDPASRRLTNLDIAPPRNRTCVP
jgi:CubicO group peptidase (beta-lactamase class C family)